MCYKEKADAGQNLHAYKNTSHHKPNLTRTRDTAIRWRKGAVP